MIGRRKNEILVYHLVDIKHPGHGIGRSFFPWTLELATEK